MSHFGNISTWPSSNSCGFYHVWPHLVWLCGFILFIVMLSLPYCICASCQMPFRHHMSSSYSAFSSHAISCCILSFMLLPWASWAWPCPPFKPLHHHFSSFPLLPSFIKCYFPFSINVHLLPVNLASCPKPLCQIYPYFKLFRSGSKMTQVWI